MKTVLVIFFFTACASESTVMPSDTERENCSEIERIKVTDSNGAFVSDTGNWYANLKEFTPNTLIRDCTYQPQSKEECELSGNTCAGKFIDSNIYCSWGMGAIEMYGEFYAHCGTVNYDENGNVVSGYATPFVQVRY